MSYVEMSSGASGGISISKNLYTYTVTTDGKAKITIIENVKPSDYDFLLITSKTPVSSTAMTNDYVLESEILDTSELIEGRTLYDGIANKHVWEWQNGKFQIYDNGQEVSGTKYTLHGIKINR